MAQALLGLITSRCLEDEPVLVDWTQEIGGNRGYKRK